MHVFDADVFEGEMMRTGLTAWRERAIGHLTLIAVAMLTLAPLSANADTTFGPFTVDRSNNLIILSGEVDARSALHFRRAIDAAPNARHIILNSPGGLVQTALLIADDIHRREMNTFVPRDAGCYSACSFLFFAGIERIAVGELGVHQVWGPSADASSAQVTVSDIIEVLASFDTPTEVLTRMLRTPPDSMYVFSQSELSELGLNRQGRGQNEATVASTRLFDHNGSAIRWVMNDNKIDARYYEPRPGLVAAGIKEGTLLFKGNKDGSRIYGTAYAFKSGCPPAGYDVIGREDGGRIVLRGSGPSREKNGCGVTGYSLDSPHAELVFSQID